MAFGDVVAVDRPQWPAWNGGFYASGEDGPNTSLSAFSNSILAIETAPRLILVRINIHDKNGSNLIFEARFGRFKDVALECFPKSCGNWQGREQSIGNTKPEVSSTQ